ncbi:MAG: C2H2 type zinc-finger protein [Siphoviridae sp. ctvD11]|nr:MAG: C2H2 type zinc-finger protein [Siphoviridae sp. ctvD11]
MFHCPVCAYQQDFDPSDLEKMRMVFPDVQNEKIEIIDAIDQDGKKIQVEKRTYEGIHKSQCPSCKTISPSWI